MDDKHYALLKSISDKLTWAVILLFIVMLNTCSLSDDLSDAMRGVGAAAKNSGS